MKRNKIVSILEYSARNKMLVGILAISLIGAGGIFLSSNAGLSNNTIGINKTVLAGTLNNEGNRACVINGNDSLVLYTSASNSNIQSYISVGEMLTINSYSNGYYNVTVQETGATGYVVAFNMQKIVSGVGYNLTSLSGTAYTTNVSTAVNLREDATMNSTSLAKLKNDTSLTLLGKQGDWYKVEANGTTGYIYGEYIAIANSDTITNSSSSSATTSKTTGVTSNSNSSSTKAISAKSSTSTTGTTSNNGSSSNQADETAYAYAPDGGQIGIYNVALNDVYDMQQFLETTVESGTKITLLSSDRYGWYKIEYGNNKIGYIPAECVSFTKPESSSSSSSSTTGTTTKSTSGATSNTGSSSNSTAQVKWVLGNGAISNPNTVVIENTTGKAISNSTLVTYMREWISSAQPNYYKVIASDMWASEFFNAVPNSELVQAFINANGESALNKNITANELYNANINLMDAVNMNPILSQTQIYNFIYKNILPKKDITKITESDNVYSIYSMVNGKEVLYDCLNAGTGLYNS